MGTVRADRWLHLVATPAFLEPIRRDEHSWRPLAAFSLMLPVAILLGLFGYLAGSLINAGLADILVRGQPPAWPADLIAAGKASLAPCQGCLMGGISATVMVAAISSGCMIGVLISALLVYRRPMRSWITAAPRFRWRMFLVGVALFGAPLALIACLPEAAHGWPDRPVFLRGGEAVSMRIAYVLVLALALPLAAAFEEVLCRGWLLQVTAAFTHSLPAILLFNSLVFSLMHVDPDPGRNLSRAVLGIALSWSALRTGGLELGIGVHTANNLVILLLAQTVQQADKAIAASPAELLINLMVSLGAVGVVELVARWAPLRAWSGLDLERAAAQPPPSSPPNLANSTLAAP